MIASPAPLSSANKHYAYNLFFPLSSNPHLALFISPSSHFSPLHPNHTQNISKFFRILLNIFPNILSEHFLIQNFLTLIPLLSLP